MGLVGLVIELVLPGALSAALLLVLAGHVPHWDLHGRVGLGVFGLLLVVLSLFLSIRLDAFTLARRRVRGKRRIFNRADPRSRLVKFILGGVVIPTAAFVAANRIELPNRQTPMSLATGLTSATPEVSRAERLASAVLRAESPTAKVQGIRALQSMASSEALEQLVRLLSDDPEALGGGVEYEALSEALASYGAQAKGKLLQRMDQMSPGARRDAAGPPGDLFERYLSAGFEGMKREIERGRTGQGAELERLQAAQAELKRTLTSMEAEARPSRGGSALPAFIMQTFLRMVLKDDADLLAFARRTAADGAWSDPVRGQALLLIAKLGGKGDLDGLYAYLESPSPLLRARAMQAIADLQSRLATSGSSG